MKIIEILNEELKKCEDRNRKNALEHRILTSSYEVNIKTKLNKVSAKSIKCNNGKDS